MMLYKNKIHQAKVAYICNLSFSGDVDWFKVRGQLKQKAKPYLKNN
jgi:hypothetical protein